MPPVMATESGLVLFGLFSLFWGGRGEVLGIAGLLGLRSGLGDRLLGSRLLGSGLLGESLLSGRLLLGGGRSVLTLYHCVTRLLGRRGLVGENLVGEIDLRRRGRLQRLPVGARLHLLALVHPLQRERESAALRVDLDDLHVDDVAL